MSLSYTTISKAKLQKKPYKLYDAGGLFMVVTPSGGKWWRLKYRLGGKEKLLSLGTFPDVGLKDARDKRDEYRRQLAAGIDPVENRKAVLAAKVAKEEHKFEVIAREWIAKKSKIWEPRTKEKNERLLEINVFPWLGQRPIQEITAHELLKTIQRAEDRGAIETAHRALQTSGQIFRYAIATGRADRDISPDLRGALTPIKSGHFSAITDPKMVAELMRAIQVYKGGLVTRSALRLAPLVFLRPGELRKAEWKEFDFDNKQWNIPAKRMKMKENGDHVVPLAHQAMEILTALKPLTGDSKFVFPSERSKDRPISENAVLVALRSMGFGREVMTGHGFRAMARTILDEVLEIRVDYIEHQLHHTVRDPNGRAYNRTAHLEKRREMMQTWADYLDKLADV